MAFHDPTLSNGVSLPGSGRDFRSAATALSAALRNIGLRYVEARTETVLNQLTDRQLADIGITRGEIPTRARKVARG